MNIKLLLKIIYNYILKMTHKKANDFIRKWNKELAIKGYSKMKLPEKMMLIEKRLKEVKSSMIETMRGEWNSKEPEQKPKVKSVRKKVVKKAVPKKEAPKKEAPKKKVPKGSHKMPDGSIMKNSDMSSDIVVTKQPVLPKKKEEKQEKKKPVKSKTNVDRKERNKLEAQFKRTFKKTVYKVLGIPNKSNPSLQEIKTMCRKLQLANHPDKGGSVEIIASINEACNVLSSTIISDDESETGLQTILRKFTNKYDLKLVQNTKGLNDLENSYKDDLQKIRAEIAKYDQDDEDEVLVEIEKRKGGKDIVKKYFDIKNNFIEKARKKRKALEFNLKEGTFTRMAEDKGYGDNVQKLATDIMKHKDKGTLPNGIKISPLMVKKANFVVNARKFKSDETPKEEARKKEAPKEAPKAESGSILDKNFKKVIKMYETFIKDFTIAEFNKAKKQGKGSIINKIKLMNKNNNEVTVNEKNNIVKELNKANRKDDVQTFYSLTKQASTLGKRISTWTKKNLTAEDVKGVKFN